jgi:subtilisin family serine protease
MYDHRKAPDWGGFVKFRGGPSSKHFSKIQSSINCRLISVFYLYSDHGTKCAGVIAAEGNNGFCGIGVAYDCNIAG